MHEWSVAKTKKVGLGLIGLGYIGKIHLRNCLRLKSARFVAVSDISKKKLNAVKKMRVKKTFTDYQQLLKDPSVDAVIIALPTHLHSRCCKEAAEAGKDIFVEKPLARDIKEGKEIISVTEKNGTKLAVGYDLRFNPSLLDLKEKLRSGALGDVEIAYATNIGSGPFSYRSEGSIPRPVPTWWFDKKLTGGGALMDLGVHLINLLRWYFGEITDIKGYFGYRFNLDFEDHATCIAKFASGPVAVVNAGWFSWERQLKVELLGTIEHASVCYVSPNRIITAAQLLLTNFSKFYLSYFRELEHFVHCVRHDLQPSPSGNDALKDLEAISLAYKNKIVLK
jgi:predicted dehydrogenase